MTTNWLSYPANKPSNNGKYLITVQYKSGDLEVFIDTFIIDHWGQSRARKVVAFAERPEPYVPIILTISGSKAANRIPEYGTLITTAETIDPPEECRSFFAVDKHITCRRPNANGFFQGCVPGGGGDIWWIHHDDGTTGAYLYTEVFDRKV